MPVMNTSLRENNLKGIVQSKHLLKDICDKISYEFNFELNRNRKDEICLGIFSENEGRDDSLPLLYLHTSECWYRSGGHTCPDLPENNLDDDDEGLAFNYDFYNPTLHTQLEDHVLGDINSKGCYPDWSSIKKMISSY